MLKILQARLQQSMNCELPDVLAGFRKCRGTRDQIANIHWIIEKAREFQKTSTYALLITAKPLTVWIITKYGKFFKRREYQPTYPACWEICMQVKKQQLEPDMEEQTISNLGKEHIKTAYCHPTYLTYMQSTSCEMSGWMKHKLESRFPGEISIASEMQMTLPLWQKVRRNWRTSWWKWKKRVKKTGLKLNIPKTRIMAFALITSWQIDGETMEMLRDLFSWAPKSQ